VNGPTVLAHSRSTKSASVVFPCLRPVRAAASGAPSGRDRLNPLVCMIGDAVCTASPAVFRR
jgi:hypothetical protein